MTTHQSTDFPLNTQYAFGTRWRDELVEDGFTPISNFFLKNYTKLNPALTHGEAMFVVHLMLFKWDADAPFPSYTKVAGAMGISDKTARRYAKALQEKGYMGRIRRTGKTNKFDLSSLFDALVKLKMQISITF